MLWNGLARIHTHRSLPQSATLKEATTSRQYSEVVTDLLVYLPPCVTLGYIYHDGHLLAVCVTLTMIMHKNAWECIHHEDHYICHQHHRHYFLQANIQFDYEASSLRKLRLSLVFVTVMYLRNCLRKTYDSLIMVIYSRTIDILCCHLRGIPPCVYYHNMASCTWSTWQFSMVRN